MAVMADTADYTKCMTSHLNQSTAAAAAHKYCDMDMMASAAVDYEKMYNTYSTAAAQSYGNPLLQVRLITHCCTAFLC